MLVSDTTDVKRRQSATTILSEILHTFNLKDKNTFSYQITFQNKHNVKFYNQKIHFINH